jgi:hypothetical protein
MSQSAPEALEPETVNLAIKLLGRSFAGGRPVPARGRKDKHFSQHPFFRFEKNFTPAYVPLSYASSCISSNFQIDGAIDWTARMHLPAGSDFESTQLGTELHWCTAPRPGHPSLRWRLVLMWRDHVAAAAQPTRIDARPGPRIDIFSWTSPPARIYVLNPTSSTHPISRTPAG